MRYLSHHFLPTDTILGANRQLSAIKAGPSNKTAANSFCVVRALGAYTEPNTYLPAAAETEEIKKEQEALPPVGWLEGYDDANILVMQSLYRERDSGMLRAALEQYGREEAIFPPEPEK